MHLWTSYKTYALLYPFEFDKRLFYLHCWRLLKPFLLINSVCFFKETSNKKLVGKENF